MKKININSFLMTAMNYAKQFSVTLRIQGSEAYTNGHLINIPRIDFTDAVSVNAAYAYLAHEGAHLKYTDFSVVPQGGSLKKDIINILEDTRIEKLIGREYIGVYENLCKLNKLHLTEHIHDLALLRQKKTLFLCLVMDYSITLMQQYEHARGVAAVVLRHARNLLGHALTSDVCRVLRDMPKAKDTVGVIEIANRLLDLIENLNDAVFSKADPDCAAIDTDDGSTDSEIDTDSVGDSTPFDVGSVCKELMKPAPQEGSREDLGVLAVKRCVPGVESVETPAINNLSRMLHRYIQTYVTTMQDAGTNGQRLNVRKAVKIPCGEDRIFKSKHLELDHDTHVSILVDASGSMQALDGGEESRLTLANKCAYMLTRALSGISNVTRDCYYFPGLQAEVDEAVSISDRLTAGTGRMFAQPPRGSTPLAQALYAAMRHMRISPKNRNIILIITDGVPDSMSRAKAALRQAKDLGIECYGLGIKTDFLHELFNQVSSKDDTEEKIGITVNKNVVVVRKADELNTVAVKQLKKMFAVKNLEVC